MTRGTIAVLNRGSNVTPLTEWLRAQSRDWHVTFHLGSEIAHQRNDAVLGMQGDLLLFVDADCVPPSSALHRIASRAAPLIGGVVLDRSPLMEVCALKTFEPTVRYTQAEIPTEGTMPVLGLGTGFLLIHRKVIDAVGWPTFRCGQLVEDVITEDSEFCLRAAEAGFAPRLDCEVRVGHRVRGLVWPRPEGAFVQWEGASHLQKLNRPTREPTEDRRLSLVR